MSVIHAVGDKLDFRKYSVLIPRLPSCNVIRSDFLFSCSVKGCSIYLAKFSICGFIVAAGSYEFP